MIDAFTYAGTARFYRSIPLEDIVPPPKVPREEFDDGMPVALQFAVRSVDDRPAVWRRIDGGRTLEAEIVFELS